MDTGNAISSEEHRPLDLVESAPHAARKDSRAA